MFRKNFQLKKRLKRSSLIGISLLFILSMLGQPVLARLPNSTSIVQTQSDDLQLIKTAQERYQAGQFEAALKLWQEAASAFENQGDKLNQAMALSNLALTYQQLSQWQQAQATIADSLNLLLTQNSSRETERILAQTLDIKGRLELETGQPQDALETWRNSAKIYQKINDKNRIKQNQINQAQALQDLGLYPKVCQTLLNFFEVKYQIDQGCDLSDDTIENLVTQADSSLQAEGLLRFGNLLRLVGQVDQSKTLLETSLQLAEQTNNTQMIASIYLNLGNTERAIIERERRLSTKDGDPERVKRTKRQNYLERLEIPFEWYQKSAEISNSSGIEVQAQLNQLNLLVESEQWSRSENFWPSLQQPLKNLPLTRTAIFAEINFAKSLLILNLVPNSQGSKVKEITQVLETAVTQARELGDLKTEAYALGTWGKLYEQTQQWDLAEELTTQALSIAPTYNSPDIAYQYSWQLGRIRSATSDISGAIVAYKNAFNTLQSLRSDLVAINPEIQFTFRESVEPVYRELVDLQLQEADQLMLAGELKKLQGKIKQVRQVIESLQLAELNNFFRDACVAPNPQIIDDVAQTAAVFYPIILPDRLEVIVSLPTQPEPTFKLYTTKIPEEELNIAIRQLQGELSEPSESVSSELLGLSKQVYNWLIRPAELELQESQVDTLVFVLDGSLRNIPMAALYDGDQYLVQKYAIALTPGLQLLNPQPLTQEDLKALLGGATNGPAFGDLGSLPAVDEELNQIAETVPQHEKRQNEEFTKENLQTLINQVPFPVVHLATHAQFGSNAEETFILTYNDRIDVKTLDTLLRKPDEKTPIELLVLSACETVKGDDRAALGLAGIAVRAGARSTVATLWTVEDQSTARLMVDFYQELANPQQKANKAQALRTAQLNILTQDRTRHPFYWAPFVLVGNWQ